MQIFRISYQEITFLCLLNIQTIYYSVNLHGFRPDIVVLPTVHEKLFHWGWSHATKAKRSAWEPGSLELIRLLILRHKTPTELLYMLVQIDSVYSSEQSRETVINIEIELLTSLIKQ